MMRKLKQQCKVYIFLPVLMKQLDHSLRNLQWQSFHLKALQALHGIDSQLEGFVLPQFLESNRKTRTLVVWNSVNFNWIQTFFSVKQGWRTGDLPSHQLCPGFDSRTRRHMWVKFVVGFWLWEEFSPGTPVIPSPQKPTFSNSNSIVECSSERGFVNSLVPRV